MSKIILISLGLLLITICCVSTLNSVKQPNTHYLLTNDSVKYWCDEWKMPFFNEYREGGIAFYCNGDFHKYRINYNGDRVFVDNLSDDLECPVSRFIVSSDTLFIHICGNVHVYKLVKLTSDTLELEEISNYNFFNTCCPDVIIMNFIESKDQRSKPINGPLINPDTSTWLIKAIPK
jgi:hypothetical protein